MKRAAGRRAAVELLDYYSGSYVGRKWGCYVVGGSGGQNGGGLESEDGWGWELWVVVGVCARGSAEM